MTKILAMTDALGNLADFTLLPGQRNDICGVVPSIKDKEFGALLADDAYIWIVMLNVELCRFKYPNHAAISA